MKTHDHQAEIPHMYTKRTRILSHTYTPSKVCVGACEYVGVQEYMKPMRRLQTVKLFI